MTHKIAVIINVGSGRHVMEQKVAAITKAFAQFDVQPELLLVNKASVVSDVVEKAKSSGCTVIVAAGGDGTLNATASLLVDSEILLGILPMGTFNHLARDLNIPLDLDQAVKVIIEGQTQKIDVGTVNDLPFFNNSSIGLYSKLVHYRSEVQKEGWSKRLATTKAILTSIGKYSFLNVELGLGDSQQLIKTPLVFIGNNCYEIEGLSIGSRKSLNEGTLCVYVIKHSGKLHLASLVLRALLGRIRGHDKFDEILTKAIVLKTRKRFLKVAIDGEIVSLESPLRYSIKPKALKVSTP